MCQASLSDSSSSLSWSISSLSNSVVHAGGGSPTRSTQADPLLIVDYGQGYTACPCSCMGKQSDVVYHIPSCFGVVYIGVTRWELKMRIPACIDYSDVELPANKPGVLTHPSHIGYHHISPLSCSYCWWLCWYLLFPV